MIPVHSSFLPLLSYAVSFTHLLLLLLLHAHAILPVHSSLLPLLSYAVTFTHFLPSHVLSQVSTPSFLGREGAHYSKLGRIKKKIPNHCIGLSKFLITEE